MLIKYGCASLRAIEEKDNDLLLKLINTPEIDKWVGNIHLPVSSEGQKKWMETYKNDDATIRLMIELSNGKTIGMIILQNIDYRNANAEIGIKIDFTQKQNRLKNDVDDAYKALLSFAFNELNLNCIYANVSEDNEHSINFHNRNNFSNDGRIRSKMYKNGKYNDVICFSITKAEFFSNLNAYNVRGGAVDNYLRGVA